MLSQCTTQDPSKFALQFLTAVFELLLVRLNGYNTLLEFVDEGLVFFLDDGPDAVHEPLLIFRLDHACTTFEHCGYLKQDWAHRNELEHRVWLEPNFLEPKWLRVPNT